MKRSLCLTLAIVMLLAIALTGCGNGGATPTTPADTSPAQTEAAPPAQTDAAPEQTEDSAGGEDFGDPVQLVFTTHLPETAIDGNSLKYFLDQVTAATNGTVTFEMHFAGSMTKSTDTLNAVSSGLADIAMVPEGFFETQFYPMFVGMLAYLTTSEWVANKALTELIETYAPMQEMCEKQNVVNIGVVVPSEVVIVSKDKEIASLDDMKGLKIRAMGAVNAMMVSLGAAPVALDVSEVYEALERGTVEAASGFPVTLGVSLKLQEVANYFIFSGIGIYNTSSLYMNKDTYDSLNDNVKQVFKDVYATFVDEYSSDEWMGGELKKSIAAIEEAGGEVVFLPKAERDNWASVLSDKEADFIARADELGYNGQEILDLYKGLVEKYTAIDQAYQLYED